jgi:hypothetical protein
VLRRAIGERREGPVFVRPRFHSKWFNTIAVDVGWPTKWRDELPQPRPKQLFHCRESALLRFSVPCGGTWVGFVWTRFENHLCKWRTGVDLARPVPRVGDTHLRRYCKMPTSIRLSVRSRWGIHLRWAMGRWE